MPEVGDVAHVAHPGEASLVESHLVVIDPTVDPGGRFIRATTQANATSVIACGSDRSSQAIRTAIRAGASAYVSKDGLTGDRLAVAVRAAARRAMPPTLR
jgi:DNA-binding NarL/FixJ family response regulator